MCLRSNPAEITASWAPTGADNGGWNWTYQSYDWKGRPKLTTLPGGATRENTYGGCGCAGGEVTTVRDERGRRRKLTKDILGRLKQVDELNWDQSVYATTTYTYNVLDQITNISQAGQTARTFNFDGYGRLSWKFTPEQGRMDYSYFANDTIQTVTDARPAWSGGQQAFMNRLATTFTEFRSASLWAIAAQRGGYSNDSFGRFQDSGFHCDFRDPDPDSDNQVRHAVGGLIAGFVLGDTPADRAVMDSREEMNTESGRADTRMNRTTMPMGNLLRNGGGFMGLADWIRDTLCENPSAPQRGVP